MDEETTRADEDIEILKCMYPELEVAEVSEHLIEAKLAFTVLSQAEVNVIWEPAGCLAPDSSEVRMQNFLGNEIRVVCQRKYYPDFKRGLHYDIKSQWMTEANIKQLSNEIVREFAYQCDNKSEDFDSGFPLLMMLFDFLINNSSSVLFPLNEYTCETWKQFQIINKFKDEVSQLEFNSSKLDCCICLETKKGADMVRLPCNDHILCRPCVTSYYSTMISEGRISNVRCPECPYSEVIPSDANNFQELKAALMTPVIPFKFFEGLLSAEICERYAKFFYDQAFAALYRFSPLSCILCPRCGSWTTKENVDDEMALCSKCEFSFCVFCLHSWHGSRNLCGSSYTVKSEIVEEYSSEDTTAERKKEMEMKYGRRTLQMAAADAVAEKLLDMAIAEENSNLKRCPGCRAVIQRTEGCNNMKCTVCFTFFCYLCGEALDKSDPYYHFREPASTCYARLFEGMPGLVAPM
ncbi:LAQU0S01e00716g1_1 [Lachancea quebecensis]|uniref:RBR-type E3 ubiquitin transferase n=1 Tax=Lachancea quebecensis TaxID=1654605 RepID=A0A0P1KLE2_9SACH|nr:LAQU0S01e00716g1_1 [Lachancea quebecensis]